MAARWRGEDCDLNADNSGFLASNTPNELVLCRRDMEGVEMDAQSCMDHSILAIFEDSAVASEDKSGAMEESETLLSALTEMLDSVEDDDATLSPFDSLPDTQLLTHPERRDNNAVELSLAERLRPRSKSPNVATFTIKIDGEKKVENKTERRGPRQLLKQQSQALFHSKTKKAEAEVEVFTSTSLVNLVRIMHSYCLRLHVEEDGDKHTVFSQEEVWKYERPSEDSDEEINVVSDDEESVKETTEEDNGKLLKSALLNGKWSRAPPSGERKRVSFGPVQVASLDESVEKGLNEKKLSETVPSPMSSTKALENPTGSELKPQPLPSEVDSNNPELLPPKVETKAKSLSLQQYRQLCLKRQPLVEKQGNYTTKWPSVSEAPTELTPILCLQGQNPSRCGPKTAHLHPDSRRSVADQHHRPQAPGHKTQRPSAGPRPHPSQANRPHPSQANTSTLPRRSGLKRPRTQSQIISPDSPLPIVTAYQNVIAPESRKSPLKKTTLVSSDPPNPVFLPLPHRQSPSPAEILNSDSNPDSTTHFEEVQKESSGTSLHPQPSTLLLNNLEMKAKLTEPSPGVSSRSPPLCPTTTQIKSSSEREQPQPQQCSPSPTNESQSQPKSPLSSQWPSPVAVTSPTKETTRLAEVPHSKPLSEEPPPPLTSDSGIEAPDLTSLLEQFEETQAKEDRVKPKLVTATSPSNLPTDGNLDRVQPVRTAPEATLRPLSTSEPPGNLAHLQTSEGGDIPEPLGTEIVLSTRPDLPARRRNPLSKAIQIIDPRPLPSKKTHSYLSEFPSAHIHSAVSSDHDYCGPVDRLPTSASQRCRASKPLSKTTDELQVATHEPSAAAEGHKQTSSCEVNTTIRAADNSAKSAMQHLRSETTQLSHCPTECISTEEKAALSTLPTPPPSPPDRGRERKRYRRRSPLSDSSSCSSSSSTSSSCSSSSASPSPKRQKRRHRRSESSSCSSSSGSPPRRYRLSYSRSRSSSWSHSRSRSPSPRLYRRRRRDVNSSRESRKLRREHEIRIQKLKAIDERRVVYVGRICRSMTHDELRQRFAMFGEVECVSLHFRERGDHYGFVTFYDMKHAFAAIDNSSKLRRPDELPFDICFGGRRQFCNSDYADLDANKDAEPSPTKSKCMDLDFDSLLKQAQRGIKR